VVAVDWTPQGDEAGDFALDAVPFRIVKVEYGTLEEGRIAVEALEDVFGITVIPQRPDAGQFSQGGGTPTAPGIAISQAPTSAIRVCLFPSDENFTITLQRANDSAFSVSLTTLSSTITGTTDYYDDTITVGQTRYYRAKLTRTGYTDGAWSNTLTAIAVAGTPGSCVCTVPTISVSATDDGTTGTLVVSIADDQGRVSLVEFRTHSGPGVFSDWATDSSVPYETTVALSAAGPSRIEWRVTYQDCAGDDVVATGWEDFPPLNTPPDSPPEANPGVEYAWIDIPLLRVPWTLFQPGADRAVVSTYRITEEHPVLDQASAAYLASGVAASSLPAGVYLACEAEILGAVGEWAPMEDGGDDGPFVALDTTTLDTADANTDEVSWNVRGDSVTVADGVQGSERLRLVVGGGDGTGAADSGLGHALASDRPQGRGCPAGD
jgi:hypothetical protein